MNSYLTAAILGTVLGLVLLISREGGSAGEGLSLRDIAGGAFEVGFYTLVFVAGLAVKRRITG